jgi:tetratricopeptide (TPR) repeat protein
MTKISAISLLFLAALALAGCSNLPRMVIPQDALSPEEHVTLGLSYESQGLQDLAEREYQMALRGQPEHPGALVALGNQSFERGALREAEQYYRRALSAVPENPSAGNNLAMVYLKRGDHLDEAERLAVRALEQSGPLRPYVLDTLAHIYMRQGRAQEAIAALEEADKAALQEDTILHDRLAQSRRELTREPSLGLGKN